MDDTFASAATNTDNPERSSNAYVDANRSPLPALICAISEAEKKVGAKEEE